VPALLQPASEANSNQFGAGRWMNKWMNNAITVAFLLSQLDEAELLLVKFELSRS
jgi:hypothetical protein